ncbi:Helix-turn-helix domain-containing protein [Pseudonocardia ammonioxydans]|uniref:Helix-turn-helix domain-containing protein n=2 Tax=Pseudonocardia ammonioxydans TaxID=260086 RepID=A0A1I5FHC5_PSUAM|nr:Helix-turn-helix domain-containing protein [Pseudonocardia ammonioxydans]
MGQVASRTGSVAVTSTTVDDALRVGTDVYHPHRLRLLDESRPFDMRLRAVTYGPVTVGKLSYAGPVRIETDDMEVAYEANVPLAGELGCEAGTERFVASPDRAVLFGPDGPTSMTGFGRGRPILGVRLDRVAVEHTLADLAGASEPLRAAPLVDLTTGRGREWWLVLRSLLDLLSGFDDRSSLVHNELVMRPLTQSLLTGMLLAADHPLLPRLLEPAEVHLPGTVRRAQDIMHDRAAEPLSVPDVARATGLSTRGLQAAFRQHLGLTPIEYLRRVRLERAHADLITADPAVATVAQVAHRWGFTHVGRFAAHYRARYGTSPSVALRSGS